MSTRGTIVVGVDGSKGARTALEFALEEAARHFFAFLDRELDGLLERWREHRAQLDTHSPNGGTDAGRSREAPHR